MSGADRRVSCFLCLSGDIHHAVENYIWKNFCLMIVSNVLCNIEHMAVQNSSDALSFLICNYFYTQLY